MQDPTAADHGSTWLVQAQRFAALGCFDEAVSRGKALAMELRRALAVSPMPARPRLEELLEVTQQSLEGWRNAAQAQRAALTAARQQAAAAAAAAAAMQVPTERGDGTT